MDILLLLFSISHNQLAGSIQLGQLPSLISCDLSYNKLNTFPDFNGTPQLRCIYLQYNNIEIKQGIKIWNWEEKGKDLNIDKNIISQKMSDVDNTSDDDIEIDDYNLNNEIDIEDDKEDIDPLQRCDGGRLTVVLDLSYNKIQSEGILQIIQLKFLENLSLIGNPLCSQFINSKIHQTPIQQILSQQTQLINQMSQLQYSNSNQVHQLQQQQKIQSQSNIPFSGYSKSKKLQQFIQLQELLQKELDILRLQIQLININKLDNQKLTSCNNGSFDMKGTIYSDQQIYYQTSILKSFPHLRIFDGIKMV